MARTAALFTLGFLLVAPVRAQQPTSDLTIVGAVIDSAGDPVAGAMVYLGAARIFSFTDSAGVFVLPDILSGEDALHVRREGFAPRSVRLIVPDAVTGAYDIGSLVLLPGGDPTLTVEGTVVDSLSGAPLRDVEIVVNGREVARTDGRGAFRAESIAVSWGMNMVIVRHVGFGAVVRMTWVENLDDTMSVAAALTPSPVQLPAITVEGDRIVMQFGRLREFWERRQRGIGRFFTRADIERHATVMVSDVLRMVPGASVRRDRLRTSIWFSRSGRSCAPTIWIDGMPLFDGDLDLWLWPDAVEAIEVYVGPAQTPAQFARGGSPCGAIVVWTR